MSLRPITRLQDTYRRADVAFRRAQYRPPGAMWRCEAQHPVGVNLAYALSCVVWGLLSRAYVFYFGMAALCLGRIVLWRQGGFLRRRYERRVRRAEAGQPDRR